MKKIRKVISLFVTLMLLASLWMVPVYGDAITLEDVVESFNGCESVKEMKEEGVDMSASLGDETEPNVFRLFVSDPENGNWALSFDVQGNILTNEHVTVHQFYPVLVLADAIGQLHGYADGELFPTFNMEEAASYTVKNEGIEFKENGSYISVKMDISKKVPLVDLSDYYLTPEDFDIVKRLVDENSYGNQSGFDPKFAYDVTVGEEESSIIIGEKNEITESTYKSILSALEVMYGEKGVNYFKSIYPQFQEGGLMVDGFEVNYDEEIDVSEYPIFEGRKIVSVIINNNYMREEVLRTEYIGETVEMGSKTLNIDFSDGKSYKLGFFDSPRDTDQGFLYKYILEPLFEESGVEIDGDTAYFNLVDGKIVVGDENNSLFKLVIGEMSFQLMSTKDDAEKTTVTLQYDNLKTIAYEPNKSQDHFRYEEYDVTVNITYGKEKASVDPADSKDNTNKNTNGADSSSKKTDAGKSSASANTSTKANATKVPKTGDEVSGEYWLGIAITAAILSGLLTIKRKANSRV